MSHSLHLIFLVHLVYLVCFVYLVEPDRLRRIISVTSMQVKVSANRLLKPLHRGLFQYVKGGGSRTDRTILSLWRGSPLGKFWYRMASSSWIPIDFSHAG
jgi:hypothetical protein